MITNLFEHNSRFRRFILLVQTKEVNPMKWGSCTGSRKPGRWVKLDHIFTMRDIFINFALSPLTKLTSSSKCTDFKETPKAFNNFRNKQNGEWSNVFWYVKTCLFWKCIQYTIYRDKTQMLKKITSKKINGIKNALFFSFAWSNSSRFYF